MSNHVNEETTSEQELPPDYRYHDEQAQAEAYKEEHGHYPGHDAEGTERDVVLDLEREFVRRYGSVLARYDDEKRIYYFLNGTDEGIERIDIEPKYYPVIELFI